MTKIVLLNVKYSPNLGDGIIAECLEAEILKCLPGAVVMSMDLAGREQFGEGLDERRGLVLRLLQALPTGLRRFVTALLLQTLIRTNYQEKWRRILDEADYAILGGGQIIADADLNFPLKVNAALSTARRKRIPISIFGVGLAQHFSPKGKRLFSDAFARSKLVHVAVRDIGSQGNWSKHFEAGTEHKAELCLDPGLLANEHYGIELSRSSNKKTIIGLGITNPSVLALHSGRDATLLAKETRDFWIELCSNLHSRGYVPKLFTNGPADDEAFLENIYKATEDMGVMRAPRPKVPADLVATIASLQALAAHRLHANIVAYSLKIPHVAFHWDQKLDSFMHLVGRDEYLADASKTNANTIADSLTAAMKAGIDETQHAEILASTRGAILKCVSDFSSSLHD